MMKLAVSVVDLDASSKGFAELHLGTGEAETFWLGRDLETAAVPLHDVVIADEAEFTGKAVLKSAPQALDAALGLRAVGRNVGDAELRKSATKLGRLAFPRKLFFDRPVVVVTHEDSVLVPIETEGDAVAAQQVAQQVEIPASIFRGKELSNGNLAGGVVQEAEEGELWAAIFEPAMKAAIEEEHFALPSAAKTSLAVRRSAPFLGGTETVLAEQTAESLPTE